MTIETADGRSIEINVDNLTPSFDINKLVEGEFDAVGFFVMNQARSPISTPDCIFGHQHIKPEITEHAKDIYRLNEDGLLQQAIASAMALRIISSALAQIVNHLTESIDPDAIPEETKAEVSRALFYYYFSVQIYRNGHLPAEVFTNKEFRKLNNRVMLESFNNIYRGMNIPREWLNLDKGVKKSVERYEEQLAAEEQLAIEQQTAAQQVANEPTRSNDEDSSRDG